MGIDAREVAGGVVLRALFQATDGDWPEEDAAAHAKRLEGYRTLAEECSSHDKCLAEIDAMLGELEAAMEAFEQRMITFDPVEVCGPVST